MKKSTGMAKLWANNEAGKPLISPVKKNGRHLLFALNPQTRARLCEGFRRIKCAEGGAGAFRGLHQPDPRREVSKGHLAERDSTPPGASTRFPRHRLPTDFAPTDRAPNGRSPVS